MNDNCKQLEVDAYCDASAMAAWKKHADDCVACDGKIRLYETLVNGARSDRKALTTEQRTAVLLAAENRNASGIAWKAWVPIAAGIAVALGLILFWPTAKSPKPEDPLVIVRKVLETDSDLAWEHHEVKRSRKRLRFLTMVTSTNDQNDGFPTLRGLKSKAERRKKYFGTHWTEEQTEEK